MIAIVEKLVSRCIEFYISYKVNRKEDRVYGKSDEDVRSSSDSTRRKKFWRRRAARGSAIEDCKRSLTNYSDPLNRRALFEGFREPRAIEPARHSTPFPRSTLDSPSAHLGSHLLQIVITSS